MTIGANEGSAPHMALNQPFRLELRIGVRHRGAVYAELAGQLAAGRDAVPRAQIARVHQGAQLVAQLNVKRYMTFGLQLQWQHWLLPAGHFLTRLACVKSQFVSRLKRPSRSPLQAPGGASHPGKRAPSPCAATRV